jgi:hypothetical protein
MMPKAGTPGCVSGNHEDLALSDGGWSIIIRAIMVNEFDPTVM